MYMYGRAQDSIFRSLQGSVYSLWTGIARDRLRCVFLFVLIDAEIAKSTIRTPHISGIHGTLQLLGPRFAYKGMMLSFAKLPMRGSDLACGAAPTPTTFIVGVGSAHPFA